MCVCRCGGVINRGGAWWRLRGCSVANVNADGAAEDGAGETLPTSLAPRPDASTSLLQLRTAVRSTRRPFFLHLPVNFATDIKQRVYFTYLSVSETRRLRLTVCQRRERRRFSRSKITADFFSVRFQPNAPSVGLPCHPFKRYGWRQSR